MPLLRHLLFLVKLVRLDVGGIVMPLQLFLTLFAEVARKESRRVHAKLVILFLSQLVRWTALVSVNDFLEIFPRSEFLTCLGVVPLPFLTLR